MHYMDICAAMSDYKHARTPVATASVDQLDFLAPAKMGEIICLKSSVNFTGKTSMEVGVRIESENTITGNKKHTASAYLTFVSLDQNKKDEIIEFMNIPERVKVVEKVKTVYKEKISKPKHNNYDDY